MPEPLALHVRRSELAGPVGPVVEVGVQIPSDVTHVEAVVELLARHCLVPPPGRRTAFRFRVALAEAIANAIVCGNRENPTLRVTVRAECHPAELRVHVTDEGDGFDPGTVPDPIGTGDLERACGRGLFLIRNLADTVEFSPRGNSLCMTFRLP